VSPALQRLRAENRFDRDAFARRVGELASIKLSLGPERAAERAKAAVALHHAYGSVESIMVRVARYLEGDAPQGADWHQALLHSMGLDVEGVRPAVFSPATIRVLRRLLGFRRFFRHGYAVELDADQLGILRGEILAAAPAILREIDALDSFLARVAAAGSD
jgi:hypothetical protein